MSARIATARGRRVTISVCLLAATIIQSGTLSAATLGLVLISGSPAPSVKANTRYRFEPTASGSGTRTFSIENRPGWATFSKVTGLLAGTPTAADAAQYANIRISMEAGSSRVSLPAFSIQVIGAGGGSGTTPTPTPGDDGGSVTLSWHPPTENIDGTALTNLAGYRIYSGTTQSALAPRATVQNPGLTRYVVDAVKPGEQYFAIASLSTKGVESSLSRVVRAVLD